MVVHLSVSVQGTLAGLLVSMDMYSAAHLDSMLSMYGLLDKFSGL